MKNRCNYVSKVEIENSENMENCLALKTEAGILMCSNSQVNVITNCCDFQSLGAGIASSIHLNGNELILFSREKCVCSFTTKGAHFVPNERSGYETLSKGM